MWKSHGFFLTEVLIWLENPGTSQLEVSSWDNHRIGGFSVAMFD
jgi:hypothetical protein